MGKDPPFYGKERFGPCIAEKEYEKFYTNDGRCHYCCSPAVLNTPLGDYSGDLTITCRAKTIPAKYLTVDQTGKTVWAPLTGSTLMIFATKNGYAVPKDADTDGQNCSVRLYPGRDWVDITFTLKNYSADNDGYIQFYTTGTVLLDDIKVQTSPTFIAHPAVNGITKKDKTSFTISWQPVRQAFNYYVDLYKRVLEDHDAEYVHNENFTDFDKEASLWKLGNAKIVDNAGKDGGSALVWTPTDTITTLNNGSYYKECKIRFKVNTPGDAKPSQDLLVFSVLTDKGWIHPGAFMAEGFYKGFDTIDMMETMNYLGVKDKVYAFQFFYGEASGLDNINIAFDSISVKTQYTFTNLDPNTEYYYDIRSHYVDMFSDKDIHHAFFVCAPEDVKATNIDNRGSFTAQWTAAPKADSYVIHLYEATKKNNNATGLNKEDYDFTLTDSVTVDGTVNSYDFTSLIHSKLYAFDVTSSFTYEKETTTTPSDLVLVDLANKNSGNIVDGIIISCTKARFAPMTEDSVINQYWFLQWGLITVSSPEKNISRVEYFCHEDGAHGARKFYAPTRPTTGQWSVEGTVGFWDAQDGEMTDTLQQYAGSYIYVDSIKVTLGKEETGGDEPNLDITFSTDLGDSYYYTFYYSDRDLVVPKDCQAVTYKYDADQTLVRSHTYMDGQIIPRGTAVVAINSVGDYTWKAVTTGAKGTEDPDNVLKGTDEEALTTGGTYYYAFDTKNTSDMENSVGFYRVNEDGSAFTAKAHTAYLAVGSDFPDNITAFLLNGSDQYGKTTDIKAIRDDLLLHSAPAYNLAGQRVKADYKGIIVCKGVKIIK